MTDGTAVTGGGQQQQQHATNTNTNINMGRQLNHSSSSSTPATAAAIAAANAVRNANVNNTSTTAAAIQAPMFKSYFDLERALHKIVTHEVRTDDPDRPRHAGGEMPGPSADFINLLDQFNKNCDVMQRQLTRKGDVEAVRWGLRTMGNSIENPHDRVKQGTQLLCEERSAVQTLFHGWALSETLGPIEAPHSPATDILPAASVPSSNVLPQTTTIEQEIL